MNNMTKTIMQYQSEFGCPITLLLEAIGVGFYSAILGCYCARPVSLFKSVEGVWFIAWCGKYHATSDYGKTWALTKEELE